MRLRIATFNVESLGSRAGAVTPLAPRVAALRPLLVELAADVLCLQEVNASPGDRTLAALDALLADTAYAGFQRTVTTDSGGRPRDIHNIVTLSRLPVLQARQVRHDFVPAPLARKTTARPPQSEHQPLTWDRPLLHCTLDAGGRRLEVVNLHLRAPLPSFIPGTKQGPLRWASTSGWAEGFFIAATKRNGQALEARLLADTLFDADADACIAVCGDFNSGRGEVPVATLRAGVDDTGNPALASREFFAVETTLAPEDRFTMRHAGRPLMPDHILVSPTVWRGFHGAWVLNRDLADEVADAEAGIAGSFHAPLVAEFDL